MNSAIEYLRRDAKVVGSYRYWLIREWKGNGNSEWLTWIMLNPSIADGFQDDNTIRRIVAFSNDWGYSRIEVFNLFAFVSTDPDALRFGTQYVGPKNDYYIRHCRGREVIVAWGANKIARGRDRQVLALLSDRKVYCLGVTSEGYPKHPCRLPLSTRRILYKSGLSQFEEVSKQEAPSDRYLNRH